MPGSSPGMTEKLYGVLFVGFGIRSITTHVRKDGILIRLCETRCNGVVGPPFAGTSALILSRTTPPRPRPSRAFGDMTAHVKNEKSTWEILVERRQNFAGPQRAEFCRLGLASKPAPPRASQPVPTREGPGTVSPVRALSGPDAQCCTETLYRHAGGGIRGKPSCPWRGFHPPG